MALKSRKDRDHARAKLWYPRMIAWALALALLYVGREVLIPLAITGLLVCLLAPAVDKVVRQGLARPWAVGLVSLFTFAILSSVAWLLFDQAARLGREMPKYEQNLQEKVQKLKRPSSPSSLTRLADMISNLGREIAAPMATARVEPQGSGEMKPVPVEVKPTQRSPFAIALEMARPLLSPLGVVGLVMLLVVAILLNLEDIVERTTKFLSPRDPQAAAAVISEASSRVTRYLWMQALVNVSYGIPVGLGLLWIGVPNALMWGILAALLRFIPFLGPWLAAAFPICMAILVDPGWEMVLWTIGLFVTMELVSNNVVEVVLYGTSTGISTVALIVSAFFWTSLWGLGGLVLATPMTVVFLVIGSHVPALRGLALLLSREPAWTPAERFQNLLGERSESLMQTHLKDLLRRHNLVYFLDEVFVPALVLINRRSNGTAASARNLQLNRAEALLHCELVAAAGRRSAEDALMRDYHAPRGVVLEGASRIEQVVSHATRLLLEANGAQLVALTPPRSLFGSDDLLDGLPVDFLLVVLSADQIEEKTIRALKRLNHRAPWTRILMFLCGATDDDAVTTAESLGEKPLRVLTSLDQLLHEVFRRPPGNHGTPSRLGAGTRV